MAKDQMIDSEIHATFSEIQHFIRLIYSTRSKEEHKFALNQLWGKISHLKTLVEVLQTEIDRPFQIPTSYLEHPFQQIETNSIPVQSIFATRHPHYQTMPGYALSPHQRQFMPGSMIPPQPQLTQTVIPNGQIFTREQLMQYTGMNGMPAYVAVNGVVYDVTNNAAWSLATHFGLRAGRDLTAEFVSCHPGQQWILAQLSPIGRLVQ